MRPIGVLAEAIKSRGGPTTPAPTPTPTPSPGYDYTVFGLLGAYDPSIAGSLWQDTAGTTPATADGHPVRRWDDLSGNARHITMPGGRDFFVRRESGGLVWLEPNTGTSTLAGPTLGAAIAQPFSIMLPYRPVGTFGLDTVVSSPTGNTPYITVNGSGTAGTALARLYAGTADISQTGFTSGSDWVGEFRANGASGVVVRDGTAGVAANAGASSMTGWVLGVPAAHPFGGAIPTGLRIYGLFVDDALTCGGASNAALLTRAAALQGRAL